MDREALIKRIDDYIADGSEVFDGETYRPLSFNILTDVREFLTRTEATTGSGEVERLRELVYLYVDPADVRPEHEALVMQCAALAQPAPVGDGLAKAVLHFWHNNDAWGDEATLTRTAGLFAPIADMARAAISQPVQEERDRLAGNRAAFEVGAEASKNGPTAELMRVVRLSLENERPAPQPVQDEALLDALHDAIRRPMGVVPDSATPFYDKARADAAEFRRAFSRERGDA